MSHVERRVAAGVDLWRSSLPPTRQRILPDACLDLIVVDRDRAFVAGPDSVARLHVTEASHDYVAVRLHDGRGPALLGVPADELRDSSVDLADLWGTARARGLVELAARAPTALASLAVRAEVDPLGARLVGLLEAGCDVAGAAYRLGLSPRQLQRRTRGAFGYGPQHLAHVLRLQRVVAAGDDGTPWARVAAETGCADQAHLSREVRALTGATPAELRRERVDVSDASKTPVGARA